jgi:hypothetical protein
VLKGPVVEHCGQSHFESLAWRISFSAINSLGIGSQSPTDVLAIRELELWTWSHARVLSRQEEIVESIHGREYNVAFGISKVPRSEFVTHDLTSGKW